METTPLLLNGHNGAVELLEAGNGNGGSGGQHPQEGEEEGEPGMVMGLVRQVSRRVSKWPFCVGALVCLVVGGCCCSSSRRVHDPIPERVYADCPLVDAHPPTTQPPPHSCPSR